MKNKKTKKKQTVKLNATLIEKAKIKGETNNLPISKQIEHWAKIGELMEENPDLSYEVVRQESQDLLKLMRLSEKTKTISLDEVFK